VTGDDGTSLTVVSPVYGCAECLPELVARIHEAFDGEKDLEVLLVCDRSPDDSWSVIGRLAEQYPFVRGLLLAKNVGQQHAVSAGLDHARGDITVVLDCDLQDRPEDAVKLVASVRDGAHIAVAESPFRGNSSRSRTLVRRLYFRVLDLLDESGSRRHQTHSFFALSRTAREAFCSYSERLRQVSVILRDLGFDPVFVAVEHEERRDASSSYRFRDRANLAFEGFVLYGSRVLKYLILLSFAMFLVTVGVAVTMLSRQLLGGESLPGWFSTFQLLLLITSIQLLSLGVTGLYLHSILTELRARPPYLIAAVTPTRGAR